MQNTLFLYLDFLGFSNITKEKNKVNRLFEILDTAYIHNDTNFKTIVFSDTLLAYNIYDKLENDKKQIELMYLIELTQNIMNKFIGENIFFRGIITEGEFHVKKMRNLDAYFGQTLIDSYQNEKYLKGVGLYLDVKLRFYNRIFRFKNLSEKFDFIYLTDSCSNLYPYEKREVEKSDNYEEGIFPIPEILISSTSAEYSLYPEILHFKEVYKQIWTQKSLKIKKKYLYTWNLYKLAYPDLIKALLDSNFNPKALANVDWSEAKKMYRENKKL